MKLHSIELENWRQHAKLSVDFDENATVIHGPNEAGKSTILEALSRGFFDKSSSQAEIIKRIKPLTAYGNVTSTVRIEFTINETKYRIEKNFNHKKGTFLYKIEGKKDIILDQDDSADESIIQLLEADLPSTRGSKPSNWGAFQWLWAPQEYRELPADKDKDPTTFLHLESKDSGDLLVTPKFQRVQNLVLASYGKYYTKTGRTSSGSPIQDSQKQLLDLNDKNTELKDKIKSVENDIQNLEIFQQQLPSLENKNQETKDELEKSQEEAIDFSSIESELKALEISVKEAKRDVKDAEKAIQQIIKSADKIKDLRENETEAIERFSRLEANCDMLGEQHEKMKKDVEEKASQIKVFEELYKDAQILKSLSEIAESIQISNQKIERIKDINEKIEKLREKKVQIIPNDDKIEEILQGQTRIATLEENLAAKGLAVEITPGKKGSLKVEVDGERIKGKILSTTGTESVSVGATGLGKVTVHANLEQASDAKVDIQRLQENIRDALEEYEVSSVKELIELNKTQGKIIAEINVLTAEKKGIDERSLDEIASDLKQLEQKKEEYEKYNRSVESIELNSPDGDLEKLVKKRENESQKANEALEKSRKDRDEIGNELSVKREELAGIREEKKHLAQSLTGAFEDERDIINQYGSFEIQTEKRDKAKVELKDREQKCKGIKQKYEDLEKGPLNKIKRLEREIENQDDLIQKHRASIDQLIGGVKKVSLEGSYSESAKIESQMEILKGRCEKEKISAEAHKLLKELLEQQYHTTISAVFGPIQEEVKRSLGYVTGFLHEEVELNEYLYPVRMGERGFEDVSLEFDDSSSGLKEALTLCVRLAVANHLSERDTQCLVLDDPFIHVSSNRSNRMIELINESIEKHGLQVIVFTHRPMEFAGFTGNMIDIQSAK